ncbi:MAG: hypothetical protein DRO88_12535 [Promethearchaeia archaeon]|nr:MAG: hypothetical protein DRO88_12535 [Candidatus Lokiarchaeia archaeon]
METSFNETRCSQAIIRTFFLDLEDFFGILSTTYHGNSEYKNKTKSDFFCNIKKSKTAFKKKFLVPPHLS